MFIKIMNIKKLRISAGITQKELADKLGVSHQTVFNWENEFFEPKIADLIRLADIFNVSIDYLVERINVPSQHGYVRSQLEQIPFNEFLDWIEERLTKMNHSKDDK